MLELFCSEVASYFHYSVFSIATMAEMDENNPLAALVAASTIAEQQPNSTGSCCNKSDQEDIDGDDEIVISSQSQ